MKSILAAASLVLAAGPVPAPEATKEPVLSGPFVHENLQVFLIHGEDRVKGTWLTLQEAMKKKQVRVIETQDVNELAIENKGPSLVFVEAGEIVKGGQQDRVVAVDLILPPKSGRMPISSFCVESGRWQKRGSESVAEFNSSTANVASKELKLAARKDGDQSKVWKQVEVTQKKLSGNLATEVADEKSRTSLQLTLENEKLKASRKAYVDALSKAIEGKKDAIGFAIAINGKVHSADVYASRDLFAKLWGKQLEAAATEALAEKSEATWSPATADAVKAALADARSGTKSIKPVSARSKLQTSESERTILFETTDADGEVLKESYIIK